MSQFPHRKVYLRAEWRHLINLTYRVPREKLDVLLPAGMEPDLWEDEAHVSLVAFDFLYTRVKGIRIPFHVNFPEINLRYYVRHKQRNGVMFVRELVPKHAIAKVARWSYNEPYERRPMKSWVTEGEQLTARHEVRFGQQRCHIEVKAGRNLGVPPKGTPDHFFKEHDLGFGVRRNGEILCYRVDHPAWEIREVQHLDLNWDFGLAYGEAWAFLNNEKPRYQLFAVGSPIAVYHPFPLRELPA